MSESVEQAALRRARQSSDFSVLSSMVDALEAQRDAFDALHKLVEVQGAEIARLHDENAELRDGMLALSNRIESVIQQTRHVMLRPEATL